MRTDTNEAPKGVFTIPEFCKRNRIAQSTYFLMARKGLGPRVMKIMSSVRITEQAEEDWRRDREIEAANLQKAG